MKQPRIGIRSGSGLFFLVFMCACAADQRDAPPTAKTVVTSDSLSLDLSVPVRARLGSEVTITLTATNRTSRTLELHLGGRDIIFDVIVRDSNERQVWRRLENVVTQSILRLEPLAPGASLVLSDKWTPRSLPPGRYWITASMPTDAAPLEFGPAPIDID